MPKKGKKNAGKKSSDAVPEYVSDDDHLYGNVDDPDPDSREYFYDDVDEFHAERDKVLLDKGYKDDNVEQSDEEEVMALDSEDSDDDEIRDLKAQLRRVKQLQRKEDMVRESDDEEDDDEEQGLPDSRAWGKGRGRYYGDDEIELKDMDDDDAEAVLEEKEALKLQRQMAEQLDDADFGLDIFKPPQKEKESTEKEEKIVKDLSKLSKREKLKLLKKESPELLTIIADFKQKMSETQDKLCPLRKLIEKGFTGPTADYVQTKFQLNLNYCTNIVFYLMLKCKQTPVHNHPVIKRLLQYRNILKQLEPLNDQMESEMSDLVSRINSGEDIIFTEKSEKPPRSFVRRRKEKATQSLTKKRKASEGIPELEEGDSDDMYEEIGQVDKANKKAKKENVRFETQDEKEALDYYNMLKKGPKRHQPDEEEEQEESEDEVEEKEEQEEKEEDEEEMDPDAKRAITYQIEKNKGLTAHKKKELRNPRVKHRAKFRKAKIRRKGQVREVRTEMTRYSGELSGIRAGVMRSRKLK